MLNFIKKYPMSILLAIIALNLFSIARSLRTEAEINRDKLICIKWTKEYLNNNSSRTAVYPTCKAIQIYF